MDSQIYTLKIESELFDRLQRFVNASNHTTLSAITDAFARIKEKNLTQNASRQFVTDKYEEVEVYLDISMYENVVKISHNKNIMLNPSICLVIDIYLNSKEKD